MRDSLCINKLRFTIVETLHTDYFIRTLNILSKTPETEEEVFSS